MRHMGGFEDLTPGRAADGIRAIEMRAWRIVESPVGSVPEDPDAGWGLSDKIGVGIAAGDIKTEEQIGRSALIRDPEILDASVTITPAIGPWHVHIKLQTIRGPVDIERDLA